MIRKLLIPFIALTSISCADSPLGPSRNPDNPPTIVLFAADSVRLNFLAGQTTQLRWEVADQNATVRIDPFPGNVPAIGTSPVVPTSVGTLNFTLTATNNRGSSQRFVTITVQ